MTPDDLNAAADRLAAQLGTPVTVRRPRDLRGALDALSDFLDTPVTMPAPAFTMTNVAELAGDLGEMYDRIDIEEQARRDRGPHRVLCAAGAAAELREARDLHPGMDAHDVAFRESVAVSPGKALVFPPDGTQPKEWEGP